PDRGWACLASVRNRECSFDESADAGARADVTITADSEDWAGMMAARRDVSALMRAGRLKVEGDLSLFAAMKRIFGLGGDRRVGGA
ncbi:MAG: SCP2 sterol-binding domain-containing protein, partial [Opitutales bacterium]|nr:SCP2 sterol-binding domain-containing protein [Opitutales bacterium]